MRFLRLAAAAVVALLLAVTPVSANTTIDALTNQFRASHGLKALRTNAGLTAIAARRAREIVTDFEHHIPILSQRITARFGNCWTAIGENIAWRTAPTAGSTFVSMWENSPEHRANLLGAYDWQGSATFRANGKDWAVQEFMAGCDGATVAPTRPAPVHAPTPRPAPKARIAAVKPPVMPNTAIAFTASPFVQYPSLM